MNPIVNHFALPLLYLIWMYEIVVLAAVGSFLFYRCLRWMPREQEEPGFAAQFALLWGLLLACMMFIFPSVISPYGLLDHLAMMAVTTGFMVAHAVCFGFMAAEGDRLMKDQ